MKGKIADEQRIKHILDACEKISAATKTYDEQKFLDDFIVNAAVCNFIMIIGEATSRISDEYKNKNEEFDWKLMKAMRNIIVHEYFGIDNSKVWQTVMNDIPQLIKNCQNALNLK